jgi:transmembrane sensor
MSVKDERVHDWVTQQAADWLIANREELATRERESFAAWLKASPLHIEEYLRVAAVAGDLRAACAEIAPSIDSLIAHARASAEAPTPIGSRFGGVTREIAPSRWRVAAMTWAAAGALCLGVLAWWRFGIPPHTRASAEAATVLHFSTGHGEQQTHRLPDDSILHLNTDTTVTVRLSAAERLVTLGSGEADFEVAHDPKRLFRVLAGLVQVLDRGTQFDVRLGSDATVITVVDGRVAVTPRPLPAQAHSPRNSGAGPVESRAGPVELTANQQLRVAQWPPSPPVAADAHGTTSWLRRQITFEHEPLSRVASEFNRYTSKPIEIATPALGKLEISGVFGMDDPTEFIAFLRTLKGVRVDVTGTRILVSQQ